VVLDLREYHGALEASRCEPMGLNPDLSMRDRWITRFGDEDDVHGPTTTIQGYCALATDTPPSMVIVILWCVTPGH
jgi:hypothetical protein